MDSDTDTSYVDMTKQTAKSAKEELKGFSRTYEEATGDLLLLEHFFTSRFPASMIYALIFPFIICFTLILWSLASSFRNDLFYYLVWWITLPGCVYLELAVLNNKIVIRASAGGLTIQCHPFPLFRRVVVQYQSQVQRFYHEAYTHGKSRREYYQLKCEDQDGTIIDIPRATYSSMLHAKSVATELNEFYSNNQSSC